MLKLLRENDVANYFLKMRENESTCFIAVPFWGREAPELLNIRGNSQIICNLESPACNPYVIEDLMKKSGVQLRSHRKLHAKIYATNKFAIVGSSNASINGLGVNGESWIEANILSDDKNLVESALLLFNEIWENAISPTKTILGEKKKSWNNRPPNRKPLAAKSLLAACREDPDRLGSVYLVAYQGALSREQRRELNKFRGQYGQDYDGYGIDIPEGARLVDLDCRDIDHPGISYWAIPTPLVPFRADVTIAVAQRSINIDDRNFKLSTPEKASMIQNARILLTPQGYSLIPLATVVQIIDAPEDDRPALAIDGNQRRE